MADDGKRDEIRFGPMIGPESRVAVRRDEHGERHVVLHRPQDGVPIPEGAELVDVAQDHEDGWHRISVLYRNGPPQVATPEYREGWDRIFGKKPDVGLA